MVITYNIKHHMFDVYMAYFSQPIANTSLASHLAQDLLSIVELMSKCSAWRTCRHSLGNGISASQVAWAEAFEGHLQSCRLRKLREAFGFAEELRFAPSACTLQDRCLVAAREHLDLQEDGGMETSRRACKK